MHARLLPNDPADSPRGRCLALASMPVYFALVGIAFITYLPSLRVLRTPEFHRHYAAVLCHRQPARLELIREEAVRFGKLRPLGSVVHIGVLATCGDAPIVYKAIHLMLFALTGVAFYHVVSGWHDRRVAFLSAVVFLLYPPRSNADSLVHVMCLERHMAMGLLLASYLAWRGKRALGHGRTGLSACLFALALLSKESVFLLPLAFPFFSRFLERDPGPPLIRFAMPIRGHLIVAVTWVLARVLLQKTLHYGIDGPGTSYAVSHWLASLRDSGAFMLGVRPQSAGAWMPHVAWAALILLQLPHRDWPSRGAGALWVALSLLPHLHLQYQGANYAYFALPWVCYSLVSGIDMLAVRVSRRPLRIGLWIALVGYLAVQGHLSARAIAAPWAALADIRQWVQEQPRCAQPWLRVGLNGSMDRETSEIVGGKAEAFLQCGTGLRPRKVTVTRWVGSSVPCRASSGESMGLHWWAWLDCPE